MDLEQIAMTMISKAGEGRALSMEAIEYAKEGDFLKAEECLSRSTKCLQAGHKANVDLLWAEAQDKNMKISILLIHAQDHIMDAMTVRELAEQMIALYKKTQGEENREVSL